MLLMSIDHASGAFNRGRFFGDSVLFWEPGTPLEPAQFLTRWMTHLCAPAFVFLAGASLAMSVSRREERGVAPSEIDRHILVRGALIVLFEVAWMSWIMLEPGRFLFQVLYAIGTSLLFMPALRRLPDGALLAIAAALVFGHELVPRGPLALDLLFAAGQHGRLIVAYPTFPWLAIMTLGWVLGRNYARVSRRTLLALAALAFAVFGLVRGLNGFGNDGLLREGPGVLQWLHVSKYPPSAAFVGLELGLVLTLLAALSGRVPRVLKPFRKIGQVALFFYLLHIHLLEGSAKLLHLEGHFGVKSAYVAGIAVWLALYPLCLAYGRYKAAHPQSLARFV